MVRSVSSSQLLFISYSLFMVQPFTTSNEATTCLLFSIELFRKRGLTAVKVVQFLDPDNCNLA